MRYIKLWLVFVFLVAFIQPLHAASNAEIEDRTREIATELRCVVCQNLSVADSPSEMAQQMRAIVREQVQAGKSTEQIKEFFVSKYGDWVLLRPKTTGCQRAAVDIALRRTRLRHYCRAMVHSPLDEKKTTRRSVQQRRHRQRTKHSVTRCGKNSSCRISQTRPSAPNCCAERGHVRDELNELEFDFQSGKLSQPTTRNCDRRLKAKASACCNNSASCPPAPKAKPQDMKAQTAERCHRAKSFQTLATDRRRRVSPALRSHPWRHADPIDSPAPRRKATP